VDSNRQTSPPRCWRCWWHPTRTQPGNIHQGAWRVFTMGMSRHSKWKGHDRGWRYTISNHFSLLKRSHNSTRFAPVAARIDLYGPFAIFASRHYSASQILIVISSLGCSEPVLDSRVRGRSYVFWRQVQIGWLCRSFLRVADSYCTFKWRCTMISTTARRPAHDAYGYGERETVNKPSCSIVGSMGKMDLFERLWVFGWRPLLPLMPQMNHLACRSHGCRSFLPRFTASSALWFWICVWLYGCSHRDCDGSWYSFQNSLIIDFNLLMDGLSAPSQDRWMWMWLHSIGDCRTIRRISSSFLVANGTSNRILGVLSQWNDTLLLSRYMIIKLK
jgi:hypothetical protein